MQSSPACIFEAADNKGTATDATTYGDVISQNQYCGGNGWTAPLTTAQKEEYKKLGKNEIGAGEAAKKPIYVINYGLEYNLALGPRCLHISLHTKTMVVEPICSASLQMLSWVAVRQCSVAAMSSVKTMLPRLAQTKLMLMATCRAWTIGAAYEYPLSKRTAVKAYAGYADASKEWKEVEDVAYNGYQVYLGLRHAF